MGRSFGRLVGLFILPSTLNQALTEAMVLAMLFDSESKGPMRLGLGLGLARVLCAPDCLTTNYLLTTYHVPRTTYDLPLSTYYSRCLRLGPVRIVQMLILGFISAGLCVGIGLLCRTVFRWGNRGRKRTVIGLRLDPNPKLSPNTNPNLYPNPYPILDPILNPIPNPNPNQYTDLRLDGPTKVGFSTADPVAALAALAALAATTATTAATDVATVATAAATTATTAATDATAAAAALAATAATATAAAAAAAAAKAR